MKREFLRSLGIAEDIIPDIINQHHDELRPLKEKADQYDQKVVELEAANKELEARDSQINQLQTSIGDNEELQNELQKYKEANDDYVKRLNQERLTNAVKIAVAKEANDPDDILAFINKDELTVGEDGTIEGLDNVITTLKESKPYLFTQPKPTGRTAVNGTAQPITKEEIMQIPDPAARQQAIRENMNLFE